MSQPAGPTVSEPVPFLRKLFASRSYRKALSVVREAWRGQVERAKVRAEFPGLESALAGREHAELAPHHARYVAEVSSEKMAASLELSVFLLWWCRAQRPRRVVDLGSGFTSYVLRRHQAEATPRPAVWSVDDDPAWLERTRAWLHQHRLDDGDLVSWDSFVASGARDFDLVVHDVGSMQFRAGQLDRALDLAAPGGLVLIDDMHRFDHRDAVLRRIAARGLRALSLRGLLLGKFGRYPYAVWARG